ncbi:MAG: GNAT family N-acetyltransferase [Gemmatimonadaceae bacterium]
MHKLARRADPPGRHRRLSATHAVRAASPADAGYIHALISWFAGRALLPRTLDEVLVHIDSYVVCVDRHDRVCACAALIEYSPSLGEVAAVAVSPDAQGRGLGSLVVRGVEALARQRGIEELFAVSEAAGFFESLGYRRAALDRYPEKVARYAGIRRRGHRIRPKPCFRKAA